MAASDSQSTSGTDASSGPARDERRPWLGLSAFTEETQRLFFGRDKEIADIFVRVREQPLTVLYGQSGLGKSSLLGAGLLPKLKVEGWRPCIVRLRYEDGAAPLIDQVRENLASVFAGPKKDRTEQGAQAATLWEFFHDEKSRPADLEEHSPVLIFDQFEEIFTLAQSAGRDDECHDLITQIADLIENRPPEALRQRFQEDRRLTGRYDLAPVPVRFVITLREDYLSHLEEWKKILPSLMRNRMRLHLLSGPQALQAVVRPGQIDGPALVEEEVAASIVRFVAKTDVDTPLDEIGAVPPLLSLVCERLNDLRIADGRATITRQLVESQSRDILTSFYEESFAGQPLALRHFVEDRMVTEGGHRAPVARDDAESALRRAEVAEPGKVVDALLARRLISAEERGGLPWLEITHDVLAPLVVRSRDERKERERAEAEQQRAERIEKERRRLRRLASAFAVLAVLAVLGMVLAFFKTREAAEQRDTARFQEGLSWMLRADVAEKQGKRYPDTLLYAAQAIGFDGVGRPGIAADEEPLRLIRQDRDPQAYEKARQWIDDHPKYLPVWSSGLREGEPVTGLSVSVDGRWLALASASEVRLFDLLEGGETTLADVSGASDLAFDPGGKRLAIADASGLRVWDVKAAGFVENGPQGSAGVTAVTWSPGGDRLVGAAADGGILLWSDGGGEPQRIESDQEVAPDRLSYSPENSFVAAMFPGVGPRLFYPSSLAAATTWIDLSAEAAEKLDSGTREAFLARVEQLGDTTALAVDRSGSLLAVGTGEGGVTLWDSDSAQLLGQVSPEQRHDKAVTAVAFRDDGGQVASASADGTVKLWNLSARRRLQVVATLAGHVGAVTQLAYAPGGKMLVTAGADGSAKIWQVAGEELAGVEQLFSYRTESWYQLDEQAAWQWAGGSGNIGSANAANLLTQWRGRSVEDRFEWLLEDAKLAAQDKRWPRFDLRAMQLAAIEVELPAELVKARRSALPQGEKIKDEFRNSVGIELVWCPAGDFMMGESDDPGIYLRHEVVLSSGFWLARHELTQAQYQAVMGDNPSTYQNAHDGSPEEVVANWRQLAPLENVSWFEADEFCRRLTDRERARGSIPAGWEYQLPTEAQWEYACRAGMQTTYSFGDDAKLLQKHGNYNDSTGGFSDYDADADDGHEWTAPVKQYPANPWGLHDMHGNVWEWCRDHVDSNEAGYLNGPVENPLVQVGSGRVFRGGGFRDSAALCRSANRGAYPSASRSSILGFRPALVPVRKTY